MTVGDIIQYNGPFSAGSTLNLQGSCLIGVSIGEDDFMNLASTDHNFSFILNGETIEIGKTYRYETGQQINSAIIQFPTAAPESLKINAVYYAALP